MSAQASRTHCALLCMVAALGCSGAPPGPAPTAAPAAEALAADTPVHSAEPSAAPRRFMILDDAAQPTARTPDGCIVLEVEKASHNVKYRRGVAPSCPTFTAALPLLHEMLTALAATGDLAEVTSIDVSPGYTAYFERLALAAARSPGWNPKTGKPKEGSANAFVVATTKDAATFFPEMLTLLAGTGLTPEIPSVEKVLVLPASQTPFAAQLSAAGVADDAVLPYDCILYFHLVKGAANPAP